MREYQVFYRNGDSMTLECESTNQLISQHFANDKNRFQNEVVRLICSSQTSHYVQDIPTNQTVVNIGCADINPHS